MKHPRRRRLPIPTREEAAPHVPRETPLRRQSPPDAEVATRRLRGHRSEAAELVAVEMARVLHSLGSADKAEETLDEMMRCYPEKAKGRPTFHALLTFCVFVFFFF